MTVLEHLLHKSLDLVPVSQICGVNRRGSSEGKNFVSRARVTVIPLDQYYIGSGFGQRDGHGLADTSRGTGNERGLAMKVELICERHRKQKFERDRQTMV